MNHRQQDLDIGGDSVNAAPSPVTANAALPVFEATTKIPKRCRVTSNSEGGVFFKFGRSDVTVSGTTGTLVGRFEALVVKTLGRSHFAYIDPSDGETILCITPLND